MSDQIRKKAAGPANGAIGIALAGMAVAMVGVAFASEPAYRLFCAVTGYGGTTQIAERAPVVTDKAKQPLITVRFDANVNTALAWRFKPVQPKVNVRLGQEQLVFFEAANLSDKPIVGTATFNVAPFRAGSYFNKTECFCFTEQVLAPGQSVMMPVSFYVDPELADDERAAELSAITLSYTFFRSRDQSAAKTIGDRAGVHEAPATAGQDG